MRVDSEGRGHVNIMDATKLINNPGLYSTFLLWLLAELFEELPEVGDPDKPGLVFFFDEAHLLFNGAPKIPRTPSRNWASAKHSSQRSTTRVRPPSCSGR